MNRPRLEYMLTVASASAAAAVAMVKYLEPPAEKPEVPSLVVLPRPAPLEMKFSPIINPEGILAYGRPGPISDELKSSSVYGQYDRRTRNPAWVAEHMTPESVAGVVGTRRNNFSEDKTIPALFRVRPKDYTDSGYDRGHQVPADSERWSQQAVDDTFRMSNMCPQVGIGFNRHYWAYLEAFCKNLTAHYPSVRVMTGPLYLPRKEEDGKWHTKYEVIGDPPTVAVPTHFFKVIFGEEDVPGKENQGSPGKVAIAAFVLPNKPIKNDQSLKEFEVELGVLERASGLEFAPELKRTAQRKLCEEVDCGIMNSAFRKRVDRATKQVDE